MAYRTRRFRRKPYVNRYRKRMQMGRLKRSRRRRIELKFINGVITNSDVRTGNPVQTCINALVQGTNVHQRIGTQITNKYLQLNFAIQAQPGQGVQRMRIMIIIDTQSNGTTFTLQDIFNDTNVGSYHFSTINTNYVGTAKRYKILHDRAIDLKVQGGATDLPLKIYKKLNIKLRSRTFYNDGNAGSQADISKNAIWLIAVTDVTSGAGTGANFGCQARFQFSDS